MRCSASDHRDSIPCHISDLLLISTGAVDTRGRSSCAILDVAQRRLGLRVGPRRPLAAARAMWCGPHDRRAVRPGNAGERHRRHRLLSGVLVPPRRSTPRARRPASALLLHFGAVDYARDRLGERRARGRARGRLHAVLRRHHRSRSTPGCRRRSSCAPTTIRSISPSRAASRTGSCEPHSIWYPRTTGIWQTVWMERVPATWHRQAALDAQPRALGDRLRGLARRASAASGLRLRVQLRVGEHAARRRHLRGRRRRSAPPHRAVRSRHRRLPQRAALEPASHRPRSTRELELWGERGELLDQVEQLHGAARRSPCRATASCSTAARTCCAWCSTRATGPTAGITAPDDEALRRDVELAKAHGLQRRAQAPEDRGSALPLLGRRLGLLVWEEMPSAYRFTPDSVERVTREWTDAIERDFSHPCIIAWVPINESWGVPDLPDSPARAPLRAGALSPDEDARPDAAGDRQRRLGERRHRHHRHPRLRRRPRPHRAALPRRRRAAAALPARAAGRPAAGARRATRTPTSRSCSSEFGGIALRADADGTWGYSRAQNAEEFARQLRGAAARRCARSALFAGFCYTQFADTYQEANGLLYADRTPKFPIDEIAAATSGRAAQFTLEPEHEEAPGRP